MPRGGCKWTSGKDISPPRWCCRFGFELGFVSDQLASSARGLWFKDEAVIKICDSIKVDGTIKVKQGILLTSVNERLNRLV